MLNSEIRVLFGNCKLIFIVVLDLKTKLTRYIAYLSFYTRANVLRSPK